MRRVVLTKRWQLIAVPASALIIFSMALSYLHLREQRQLSQHEFSILLLTQITPILSQASWPVQSQQLGATLTAVHQHYPALQQLKLLNARGEDVYHWSLPQARLTNSSLQFELGEKAPASAIDVLQVKLWQPIALSTMLLIGLKIIAVVTLCLMPFSSWYFYAKRARKSQLQPQEQEKIVAPPQADIKAELVNVSAYLVAQLASSNCQFIFHCAPSLPKYLYVDGKALSRIFILLLQQAQKITTDDVVVLKLDWELHADKVTLLASIYTQYEINNTHLVLTPDVRAQQLTLRMQGELNYTASATQTLQYRLTMATRLPRQDPLMDADQCALRQLMMSRQVLLVGSCPALRFHLQELLGFYGAHVHRLEDLDQAQVWLRQRSAHTDIVLFSCPDKYQDFDAQFMRLKTQLQAIDCPLIVIGGVKDKALFLRYPHLSKQRFLYKPIVEVAILATLRLMIEASPPQASLPEYTDHNVDNLTQLPECFQGIQLHAALERLGSNRALSSRVSIYLRLLNAFRLHHNQAINAIAQAMQGGDEVEACRAVHQLKTVAAAIGAQELQKSAAQFESALRQGRVRKLRFNALQQHLDQAKNAIEALSVVLDPPL